MDERRPSRRNRRHNDGQNNNPFAGPLPNFGISLFAVCNDPEPDKLVSDNEDNDDVEKKKAVCRICLCSDKKLYAIPPQNRSTFRDVLNKDLEEGNPVPQRVCFECNEKMTTFTTFRTRALQTNSLLYTIIRPFANVSDPPYGPGAHRCFRHRPGSIYPRHSFTDGNIPARSRRLPFYSQSGTPEEEPQPQ